MQKVIIALIAIAILVSGYRFIVGRRKPPEEKPAEIIEILATPTPIPEEAGEKMEAEVTGQDLPSAGVSSEDSETEVPSQEEIKEIIKEFRGTE